MWVMWFDSISYCIYFAGYCAEYSKVGTRIQGNDNAPCQNCPKGGYRSNETFMCKLFIHPILSQGKDNFNSHIDV